jgi:hypothetical protein
MAGYKSPGVYVEEVPSGSAPIAGVGTSTAAFIGVVPDEFDLAAGAKFNAPAEGEVKLVTNFTEFKKYFGDFSKNYEQNVLAHAVYGFFNNGGTRCFVTRVNAATSTNDGKPSDTSAIDIAPALKLLEPIDEIAIVAAPGLTAANQYAALTAHCENNKNAFAILDGPLAQDDFATALAEGSDKLPGASTYAAYYFPWIQVFDPAGKAVDPASDSLKHVPPSGHIAGIYARTDAQRGVHKAPANETIFGALGLKYAISKAQQDGLNLHGVNCIRRLNGNIRVWGARTLVDKNKPDFTYINVRRLFIYLRESIDQGTQWAVFEPNDHDLWAKITRNVSAFLRNVWSAGALFGETAELAFYVKCDAETNPPEVREQGMVVTEIGVAVTKPAEFVVFRLGQRAEAA